MVTFSNIIMIVITYNYYVQKIAMITIILLLAQLFGLQLIVSFM